MNRLRSKLAIQLFVHLKDSGKPATENVLIYYESRTKVEVILKYSKLNLLNL